MTLTFKYRRIVNCQLNMHLGNHLEQGQELSDVQLNSLSQQLKECIQKAMGLARSCKIGNYEETQYQLTSTGELICPEYKDEINYNQEFWKRYLKNEINFAIIKDVSEKVAQLEKQVKQIENISEQYQKLYKIKNRKKNRRLAVQIEKSYECPYQKCYRVYGSDVSLNLHIKLKHNGGNKTDRQKLAQQICVAQQNGLPLPQMRFNLPLGFVEDYKKNVRQKLRLQKEEWASYRLDQ